MGYNRCWLEDKGSEDSHGRTLWALGVCALTDANLSRRSWPHRCSPKALAAAEGFRSPRAWAFVLLGLDAYCTTVTDDVRATRLRPLLADRLISIFDAVATDGWVWFEEGLAYDNARLSQALIMTGIVSKTPRYVDTGLKSLRWLVTRQTSAKGQFRPVGTAGFGAKRQSPQAFDQQPLEARRPSRPASPRGAPIMMSNGKRKPRGYSRGFLAVTICRSPWSIWKPEAAETACTPTAPMRIAGGESVVSYLLGLSEIRQIARP